MKTICPECKSEQDITLKLLFFQKCKVCNAKIYKQQDVVYTTLKVFLRLVCIIIFGILMQNKLALKNYLKIDSGIILVSIYVFTLLLFGIVEVFLMHFAYIRIKKSL
ncbi:hypothetical protein [Anaerosacchariphilus polymeriproducens]|uniref:Uncharacterized protein n=1 Tax=Anaerosacchariphilus polymeriproducens TaxID=1812858 RepID=A0A371AV28_9FIRM|nr:hypothetical protein [Anaerosacchariphilus polymeriproducens]RDU23401.1 hypothetical protein DWV06_10125 [Anaerosacchariphilus polymeriproducens]